MKPDQLYSTDEHPSLHQRRRMWRTVEQGLGFKSRPLFVVSDKRSFAYGMAAAILLYFASVGAYGVVKSSLEKAQPTEVRLDKAYQSAIREFERIVPVVLSNQNRTDEERGILLSRKEQLELVDAAIQELKRDRGNDLSSLISMRLRELYSLKLRILQEMVEKGELEP